jgi:hypothetical protein
MEKKRNLMERFLAVFASNLPASIGGVHIQRQASYFGRFLERLFRTVDKDVC